SPFTDDEDRAIARFQADEEKAGNWAELAEGLPGRSVHQVKDRWTRVLRHGLWEKKSRRADSRGKAGGKIKHQLVAHEKLRGTSLSEATTAKARRLADESARAKSGVVVSGEATTSSVHRQAKQKIGTWTAEEHRLFLEGLERHGINWAEVATHVGSRTVVQIRSHAQRYRAKLGKLTFAELAKQMDANPPAASSLPCRTSGRKPKQVANFGDEIFASASNSFGWTPEEDERLTELVGGYGLGGIKWREIAAKMPGKGRDSTMCEYRWRHRLDTSVSRSPFTDDEDRAVTRFQADEEKAGNWAELAEGLPGRSVHQIKQRWTRVLSHGQREKKGRRADSRRKDGCKIKHQLVAHEKEKGGKRQWEEEDAFASTSKKTWKTAQEVQPGPTPASSVSARMADYGRVKRLKTSGDGVTIAELQRRNAELESEIERLRLENAHFRGRPAAGRDVSDRMTQQDLDRL
ncbi:hypothetical protein THAOC_18455, partial [Thalassiosira oceanica]